MFPHFKSFITSACSENQMINLNVIITFISVRILKTSQNIILHLKPLQVLLNCTKVIHFQESLPQ